jgi:TolA-binding protein
VSKEKLLPMNKQLITLLMFFCGVLLLPAQTTIYHTDNDALFRDAMDQYEKEKYNIAQKLFEQAWNSYPDNTALKTLSQYYVAQCAVHLFNADAPFLTSQFVKDNPGSAKVNEAWFSLGGYYYTLKKWGLCIETFDKTELYSLTSEQQAELHFKKGYSYFMKKDYEAAKLSFYEIKDKKTKYTAPASYYYGHIHYQEENYQTALNEFLKIADDKTFGPIAPYYIVQIYYMQKKYQEIVDFTPGIISTVTEKRLAEVARITGEAFYKLESYTEAIPYFEMYMDAASSPADEAVYQLAYACYKTDSTQKAIPYFEKISINENALGQNASYYLASCYLKQNDKENARKAFASAMRSDADPVIKQDAMFNYALMTFEVGGDPFNDAVRAFEDFIEAYPESKRIDEARRMLIQAYLGARNYKQALASIEKVEVKNDELKEAYQRIAYNRGIELFNVQEFFMAAEMFNNALKYTGFNAMREAKSWYWLAESNYRLEEFNKAVIGYQKFKEAPVAHTTDEFRLVNYNLGYTYYKLAKYAEAANHLRQFVTESSSSVDKGYIADAQLRIADCYFMQKSYFQAIDFYQRALDAQTNSADYALLQKGICLGLAKKELDKISTLRELTRDYPASVYADDAFYEIAQEYLKLQDAGQAIEALVDLFNNYPQSEFAGKALVQTGLLFYNADNNEEAIKYYKLAVTNFNGTEEARNALLGLKNIYIDLGQINEYSAFVDGLSGNVPRLSINEKDSLTYLAAEKFYMTARCDDAKTAFKRYILDFPEGAYLLKAHFYCGDCFYQSREYDEALTMFEYVLNRPQNAYTEQTVLGAARMEISRKNYQNAIDYYQQLVLLSSSDANLKEAKLAIMRSEFLLERFAEALKSANNVLTIPTLSVEENRLAKFIRARSLHKTGRDLLAIDAYREVSDEVLSYQGAESKYRIIEILFTQEKYDEAEKEILAFSGQSTSHEYWIARSFITWAEIFAKRENYFQAIETVQSIINYYENTEDGILDLAKETKLKIEKTKLDSENSKPEESIEVDLESKNE